MGGPSGLLRGLGDRLAGMSAARRWGAGASVVWTVVVVGYAIGFSTAVVGTTRAMLFLDTMFFLMALVLPLLLVWLAVWLAEEMERQRQVVAALAEVASPLIDALVATRAALEANVPASPGAIGQVVHAAVVGARGPDLGPQVDRVLAGQARVEVMLQRLAARQAEPAKVEPAPEPAKVEPAPRPAAPEAASEPAAPPAPEAEPAPPPDAAGPDWATLVRALDFPRDAEDAQGFEALRAVLRHPGLAQMLQAAEDVLNLLSQEAVYVDELPMDPVDPAAWRRFVAGTRGAEVAAVGGIHDQRALELTRGLMQSDTIFRDTALFFQRRFDAVLGEFAADADDTGLTELAGTRSGRAFMLLVRLSGSLD